MPRMNRWMVFPGELRHGMMPIDSDPRPRYVILFNYWASHTPSAPNCQVPNFTSYAPLCASSPTSEFLLDEEWLEAMWNSEHARLQRGVQKVQIERLTQPALLEYSSTCGELPVAMPMPSYTTMRRGETAFHVDWREAARQWHMNSPSADGQMLHDPGTLSQRLRLFEQLGEQQKLARRADDINSWLKSNFLHKAKALAEAEFSKAAAGDGNCKLGLRSLQRYLRKEVQVPISSTEARGAFFSQSMPCVEHGVISIDR
eukprot:3301018-Amphidinium_carterae.1